MTPIHWAVVENHFLVIKLLIENNAELNIKNKVCKCTVFLLMNFYFVIFLYYICCTFLKICLVFYRKIFFFMLRHLYHNHVKNSFLS